ncbi:hypothetical protein ANCDUO_01725 [Ancylostoma duodenale]|uniref:Uncharacterized protein n=1 Tax=Ancylostoma duodenale TaxID=51022 RepID=A0A0C2H8K8_9BILA|nr:hypothetical protein ANCDUO_01725 [Ancylostoma duodenale]
MEAFLRLSLLWIVRDDFEKRIGRPCPRGSAVSDRKSQIMLIVNYCQAGGFHVGMSFYKIWMAVKSLVLGIRRRYQAKC